MPSRTVPIGSMRSAPSSGGLKRLQHSGLTGNNAQRSPRFSGASGDAPGTHRNWSNAQGIEGYLGSARKISINSSGTFIEPSSSKTANLPKRLLGARNSSTLWYQGRSK